MAPDAELDRDDRMGIAERRIEVAIFLADIARRGRTARLEFAGLAIGVQQNGQLLHIEQDPVGGILGEIRIVGEHHGDRLAHIAHRAVASTRWR